MTTSWHRVDGRESRGGGGAAVGLMVDGISGAVYSPVDTPAQVDRRQGNTGGLGGAFAFFYGVGRSLPFPEMHPYKPSKRYRLFQLLGKFQAKFSKKQDE